MASSSPQQIGSYQIIGELGKGAMGRVYKAYDQDLDRQVAIKVLSGSLDDNSDELKRFKVEARSAARLNHPNLTQIYHTGTHQGQPYFVMEFVSGSDLNKIITQKGKIPLDQAISIIIQICSGLAYAAEKKVIHRDIKPANIMLSDDGTAKLTDFGLARLMDVSGLTMAGELMGTPSYISPEQVRGEKCSYYTDIYSLGATFYDMLAGRPPFEAETFIALCAKHATEPLPPLRKFNPDVSQGIFDIINKMMAKKIEKRYNNYNKIIEALEKEQQAFESKPTKEEALDLNVSEDDLYQELIDSFEIKSNPEKDIDKDGNLK